MRERACARPVDAIARAFVVAVCAMALAGCSSISYRGVAAHAADNKRSAQPNSVASAAPAGRPSRMIPQVEEARLAKPEPAAPIPLPPAALLVRAPEPSCEAPDVLDERQKLDYERQCYRHAEMIVRARLELLQASVERTIRAVRNGAQTEP
jgi:hypothetical protein